MKNHEDNYGGIEEDLSLKSLAIWFIICLTFGLSPLLVLFL